jgi:hemolysin III
VYKGGNNENRILPNGLCLRKVTEFMNEFMEARLRLMYNVMEVGGELRTMKKIDVPHYTVGEDIASSITHGIAAGLSIAGLSVLVTLAALQGDPWRVVAFSIYGGTLVALYLSSTLYHGIRHPRARVILRRFDHAVIYMLIAGTYTPFALVLCRGNWGWMIFGITWGIALFGVCMKAFFTGRFEVFSLILYLALGWTAVFFAKPMIASIPLPAIIWMAVGGLFYTGGVAFYVWDRLPFNHAIWHVFVVAGSTAHFFAVFFFVLR